MSPAAFWSLLACLLGLLGYSILIDRRSSDLEERLEDLEAEVYGGDGQGWGDGL